MSQKKETQVIVLSLITTITLIFGGMWFLMERWAKINPVQNNNTSTSSNSSYNLITPNNVPTNCTLSNSPQGIFNYGGSTTWAPIRRDVDSVLLSICPQFTLRYTQPTNEKPGSGTGIKMLIDNQLAFSQSSRSIKAEENTEAQKKGFSLKEIPIALDGIAIAVNPQLNVSGLTVAQLKDIYTGKITNWKNVGGPNLLIQPVSRTKEAGGTVEFFVDNVLNKENFGTNVIYSPTTTEAIRKIASIPGGIYYASAPEVVPQCTIKTLPMGRTISQLIPPYQQPYIPSSQCPGKRNQLNIQDFRSGAYPITRNLFVIVKQNNQTDQQAGEAYANWLVTPQGQELIEKAGFIRIK
ncbi:substrate-binding domain-containing protein [Anabaena cylindrica FACHB-243]|uniref:Phosphate ABC transporter substrate-binding protein, PhoT family n=1 Tax=Anabaena cylindrica (strain ATCC 27899 / PCC 7122) TaxID=272123 RepID=K9ZG83_ANACC|nr:MULTISPECIES: substrate-binding domain-containing protein [Anabaena]AFZ58218.1 phosphate ABC transporter substrate-binding protein, PhoT family [Anabaena cylindrica PCC 7122]MBD2419866.1 substrate-binding domain-containing protein [Anabaena cylindrica FACHB-243]MBY5280992.1 phosphate ABC transporter substrate-binding protein [Anabaena sp. CCAP 1446/1C]MBY5307357.1 phosphate ABC transporter substrate-binding protein [Anabaena sp. CCAP 1446/1C]MCM2407935.1 substrate-binding domain-containing 